MPEAGTGGLVRMRADPPITCWMIGEPVSMAIEINAQHDRPSAAALPADVDVLVIGAGPAGLTAAYCLTKEMTSVAVIEKDPHYVGGISRTVRYKDFMFD